MLVRKRVTCEFIHYIDIGYEYWYGDQDVPKSHQAFSRSEVRHVEEKQNCL